MIGPETRAFAHYMQHPSARFIVLSKKALAALAGELGGDDQVSHLIADAINRFEKPVFIQCGDTRSNHMHMVIPGGWGSMAVEAYLTEMGPYVSVAMGLEPVGFHMKCDQENHLRDVGVIFVPREGYGGSSQEQRSA